MFFFFHFPPDKQSIIPIASQNSPNCSGLIFFFFVWWLEIFLQQTSGLSAPRLSSTGSCPAILLFVQVIFFESLLVVEIVQHIVIVIVIIT
jgi:hypothetical protein